MIRMSLRTLGVAAAAAFLLFALAFLFVRTQTSGYRGQVEVLALLRELRDSAQRWDNDALSMANDLGMSQAAIPERGPMRARILQELESPSARAVLGEEEVKRLRAGLNEREAAFRGLREAHARSLVALEAVRQS